MSAKLELYGYWRSSSAYRVRIALALKNLPYEYKAIHLRKGEQKSPEFTALSPNQTVPVLVVDGQALHQSLAIIEYLEETHPSPSLYPKDPFKRAHARAVALMIGADIQPLQNLRVLNKISDKQDEKEAYAREVIEEGFARLERFLKDIAGQCCVGDEVTVGDIFLVPQVYNALRFKVDLAQYPTIQKVYNHLVQLDAFKAAAPEAQPDSEV